MLSVEMWLTFIPLSASRVAGSLHLPPSSILSSEEMSSGFVYSAIGTTQAKKFCSVAEGWIVLITLITTKMRRGVSIIPCKIGGGSERLDSEVLRKTGSVVYISILYSKFALSGRGEAGFAMSR